MNYAQLAEQMSAQTAPPPPATEEGGQEDLHHMHESVVTMEDLIRHEYNDPFSSKYKHASFRLSSRSR